MQVHFYRKVFIKQDTYNLISICLISHLYISSANTHHTPYSMSPGIFNLLQIFVSEIPISHIYYSISKCNTLDKVNSGFHFYEVQVHFTGKYS